ncbi:MAG: site-2 protease family protein [Planctomycetales bacterium]
MTNRQNPLFWSFGLGSWLGVRLRVSWLMLLLLAYFLHEFGWQMGCALFGALFISILLHEAGHIVAARVVEGSGDEILIWPLGGLAFVDHSQTPRTQFITAAGGPAVNLVLCLLLLPAVWSGEMLGRAFNPLELPFGREGFGERGLLIDIQVLLFSVNWMLLAVNLIPAYPLDGGQMARSWFVSRFRGQLGTEMAVRAAFAVGIVLAVVAVVVFKHMVLLSIAFMIVLLAMQESFQLQVAEGYDDSFMGYDFSEGYTSLEKSERARRETRPGLVARWLEARRAEKLRKLEQQDQQVDVQLDEILAKVHERGMEALTASERRILKRASDRFRSKGQDAK